MCITTGPAEISGTTVLVHEAKRGDEVVHVLAYQNIAASESGPNALVFPVPAASPIRKDDLIDTSRFPNILNDLAQTFAPQSRAANLMGSRSLGDDDQVAVHQVGIYHVVVIPPAADAAAIWQAIESQVPAAKRPSFTGTQITGHRKRYPGEHFLFCCFDNAEAQKSQPILVVFSPLDPTKLRAPALDDHTGNGPDLNAEVAVDHTIVFSSYLMEGGEDVFYDDQEDGNIPDDVLAFLPRKAIGANVQGWMPNGDFEIDLAAVRTGTWLDGSDLRNLRVPAPGA